jgi:hypothetical protein
MNVESLLVYGVVAAGGWLLRHVGVGAGVKFPGVAPAASPVPVGRVPVMATLKTDVDQIVKSAIESAVKQAIDDIKAAVPQPPRPTP